MVDVLDSEIALKLGGEWVRFRVSGFVQPALTSPFPGKIVIGDYERDTEELASNYIMADLGGGFGVHIMDPRTQFDRFEDSTLWTLQKNEIILPPRAKDCGRGTASSSAHVRAGAQFGDFLFVAFDDDIRRLENDDSISASKHTLGNTATDATVFNDLLLFAYGDGYDYTSDGATWTTVTDDVDFFALWDSKLWKLKNDGTSFALSTDGTTWTSKSSIPGMQTGDVRGLVTFFTPDSELHLHAATKEGLWAYDDTADTWRQTLFQHARHPYGGDGLAFHRDALYTSAGLGVYKFTGSTVTDVGPDREWGLTEDLRGNIKKLTSSQNWLIGLLDASQTPPLGDNVLVSPSLSFGGSFTVSHYVGMSTVMLFNDRGWHHLWRSGSNGTGAHWAKIGDAYSDYRLYWGADNKLYYTKLSPNIHSPLQSSDLRTWGFESSGYLVTPWFPGGWDELEKLAIELKVRTADCSSTEKISVYAGYDLDDGWNLLGTITTDGVTTFSFGSHEGITQQYIRFRFELERGSDETKTPVLAFAALKYLKAADGLWGIACMVDTSEDYNGLTPQQQVAQLELAASTKTLIPTQWRTALGQEQLKYMRVSRLVGQEIAGNDGRGRWQLALTQV